MTQGSPALRADLAVSAAPVVTGGSDAIPTASSDRPLVLIGMMGAGKTVVGKRLAARLGRPFVDSDHEIEACAQLTITEIFARHGEPYFRDREHKVVTRLVDMGARVIATGGGSFMHAATRAVLKERAVTIWLKADLDVLMRRVRKRQSRPLLQTADPEATLRRLIDERYPVYAQADITILSRDGPHEQVVDDVVAAVDARWRVLEGDGSAR